MQQFMIIADHPVIINRSASYKNITLRIVLSNPSIRISVPMHASKAAIEHFFISNLEQIEAMQAEAFAAAEASAKQYVTDEMHHLFGEMYPLKVEESSQPSGGHFDNGTIYLSVKKGASRDDRGIVMDKFLRETLKEKTLEVAARLEPKMGVHANKFTMRLMKTRWGSCNINKKTISINLLLVQMPLICLESVVAHELVHLLETNHNKRFYSLMDQYYPAWQEANELLKEFSHKVD